MISAACLEAEERLEILQEVIDCLAKARMILGELDGPWAEDAYLLGDLMDALERERAASWREARRAARQELAADLAEYEWDQMDGLRAYFKAGSGPHLS